MFNLKRTTTLLGSLLISAEVVDFFNVKGSGLVDGCLLVKMFLLYLDLDDERLDQYLALQEAYLELEMRVKNGSFVDELTDSGNEFFVSNLPVNEEIDLVGILERELVMEKEEEEEEEREINIADEVEKSE